MVPDMGDMKHGDTKDTEGGTHTEVTKGREHGALWERKDEGTQRTRDVNPGRKDRGCGGHRDVTSKVGDTKDGGCEGPADTCQ